VATGHNRFVRKHARMRVVLWGWGIGPSPTSVAGPFGACPLPRSGRYGGLRPQPRRVSALRASQQAVGPAVTDGTAGQNGLRPGLPAEAGPRRPPGFNR